MSKNTVILYSNYDLFSDSAVSDVRESIADYLEVSAEDVTEEAISSRIYEDDDFLRGEIFNDLDAALQGKYSEFCAVGKVGLWNGARVAMCGSYDSPSEVIRAVASSCNYVEISIEGAALNVRASHHDGTHYFTIKGINSRAEKAVQYLNYGMRFFDWLTDYCKRPSYYLSNLGRLTASKFL